MPGLYVHIPFCRKACSYCDFHFSTVLRDRERMARALATEVAIRRNYSERNICTSLYFGGGTPSVLEPSQMSLIFESIHRNFSLAENAEITIEVNPDDVTGANLSLWRSLGFNRLSIGVQSFDDEELRWMNRAHSSADAFTAFHRAREAGFSNISIDLIYGSRFQDLKKWEATLRQAATLSPEHISLYNLTIEGKNTLAHLVRKGAEPEVDDALSRDQFLMMTDFFQSAGYQHYEISNLAKPGYRAVHNSSYWRREPYLGLGPSAHSFNGRQRHHNVANNQQYMRALETGGDFFTTEVLSERDHYNEYVMTALRTSEGCDASLIQRLFGADMEKSFRESAKRQPLLRESDDRFVLTPEGRLFADGIAASFFLV